MLKLAYPFAAEVAAGMTRELDAGRLTHYLSAGYYDTPDVPDSDWKDIARASVEDTEDGPVVRGYLWASVFRHGRSVTGIGAVRFGEPSETFTADFMRFLRHLFETHGMNRVFWTVCVGNPAQRAYDVAVTRYGGRVVGRMRDSSILTDGTFADEICYEIHADDYAGSRVRPGPETEECAPVKLVQVRRPENIGGGWTLIDTVAGQMLGVGSGQFAGVPVREANG